MRRAPRSLLVALTVLQGCASADLPLSDEAHRAIGTLAIAHASYAPRSNFVARSREPMPYMGSGHEGAAAVYAVANPGATVASIGPAITLTGELLVLVAPVILAAGAVVAIDAATQAVPQDKVREIEAAVRQSAAELDVQAALATRVRAVLDADRMAALSAAAVSGPADVRDTPRYAALKGRGVDTVFEIGVTDLLLAGCEFQWAGQRLLARAELVPDQCPGGRANPAVYLSLEVRARLVRVADGEELLARSLRYHGARRTVGEWMANGHALLREEVGRALARVAGDAADATFLATSLELGMPPSLLTLPGLDPEYGVCWLAPLEPATTPVVLSDVVTLVLTPSLRRSHCAPSGLLFSKADSLQPTLRWGEFPRRRDRETLDAGTLGKLGAVTYDLKVWQVEDCVRSALVYERTRLARPEHRLEEPLAPGQRYFWTFRARFMHEGRLSATPWAFFAPGTSCFVNEIPEGQYHRFATPPGGQG